MVNKIRSCQETLIPIQSLAKKALNTTVLYLPQEKNTEQGIV